MAGSVRRKSGQSMALAVGGALESLYAEPGALDIIVQRRQARNPRPPCRCR